MAEDKSLCDTCFWCSISGWCTKGEHPVKHYDPVTGCPEYIHRLGDFDKTHSGLLEE